MTIIHPTAFIEPGAEIGENVTVGAFSIIRANVVIEANTVIESNCDIGYPSLRANRRPLIIGANSLVRSHTVIYEGSTLGPGLVTGHHVTIRELTTAGKGMQIGTLGDIQGDCVIGDYLRAHSNVHIANGSAIGNFVWLYPGTLFTNDPNPPSNQLLGVTLGDFVVSAVKVTFLPGVTIGSGSLITAHSLVNSDFEADSVISGSPARKLGSTKHLRLRTDPRQQAYPWLNHFKRGYPEGAIPLSDI